MLIFISIVSVKDRRISVHEHSCEYKPAKYINPNWDCLFTLLQLCLVTLIPLHQSVCLCRTKRRVEDLVESRVSLLVVDELCHLID